MQKINGLFYFLFQPSFAKSYGGQVKNSMIYFTSYANNKFDILNKHKVFLRKEEIEEAATAPDEVIRQGDYFGAVKDGIKVIYKKEGEIIKVITFFPIKN